MPDFGDRRVMACTPADLKRWLGELCGAVGLAGLSGTGQTSPSLPAGGVVSPPEVRFPESAFGAVAVDAGDFVLTIRWRVLDPRRIALLEIAQLEVEFEYPGSARAQAREWISRFDRHTQRGGG